MDYKNLKTGPGQLAPVDYIENLDALKRMGNYFAEELERLGSKASVHAQNAVDVIALELDLRRHMAMSDAAKAALSGSLLPAAQ
ncbi:MAG: hypothetical protein IOC90_13325 [Methylocystis sp.]|nr:hypothetical protein [Methylocystis sp.]MCA3588996.1 hypothetical protein [Methylocystis sp.]MCA3592372.1 hypothetical protein [Methylocystis sp.]